MDPLHSREGKEKSYYKVTLNISSEIDKIISSVLLLYVNICLYVLYLYCIK